MDIKGKPARLTPKIAENVKLAFYILNAFFEKERKTKMKRIFVFTLIAFFAIACLFLMDLSANWNSDGDYGFADMPFQDVYGYSYVTVWYDAETSTAYSSHYFFLNNGDNVPVSYSYYFENEVTGPENLPPQEENDSGVTVPNEEDSESELDSYDMEGRIRGLYTISGDSDLFIDADFNHDGMPDAWDSWHAVTSTEFNVD